MYKALKGSLLVLLPLMFWAIPVSWLETRPSICLIRRVTGHPCPGCGMVRSLAYLGHGQVRQAWRANRLFVIIAPLLAYSWAKALNREFRP